MKENPNEIVKYPHDERFCDLQFNDYGQVILLPFNDI